MAWRGYHRLAVAAFQTSTLVSYLHSLPVVSSFVAAAAIPRNTAATKMASSSSDDPYLWLEDVESEASLDFAKASNEATLKILGNPEDRGTYQKVLAVLESDDRIPYVQTRWPLEPSSNDLSSLSAATFPNSEKIPKPRNRFSSIFGRTRPIQRVFGERPP